MISKMANLLVLKKKNEFNKNNESVIHKVLDEFINLNENELARYINEKILSNIKIWKVKLTKVYLNNSLSSYDLIGISDEILKQQILIEAITKDDIISHNEILSKFRISDNVIYIPKEEKDSDASVIKLDQIVKQGWDEEDFLAVVYSFGKNFYGFTCFELPKVNNPINKSLEQISRIGKIISLLLDYYFYHNIAPYLDSQTKIYNRNYLNKFLSELKNNDNNFLLINIDINNLKKINDLYGHLEGDKVINYVAKTLRQCTRENEKIIRFGGDEFLIIADNANIDNAAKLLNRIEESLNQKTANLKSYNGVSIGYAIGKISSKEEFERLYKLADEMMYQNKKRKNVIHYLNSNRQ
ncbi:MAG: hypothetical protein PWR32_406 [Candidatus Woesearchaeota archaeon]|nr:hypothetical protein [Candidatus Woesearchaeota archaeon]